MWIEVHKSLKKVQKLQFSYQQLEVGHKNEYAAFVAHKILEPPIISLYVGRKMENKSGEYIRQKQFLQL